MKFAKIYEDTKYGQILVRIDETEEGDVEVKFTGYMTCLGLGFCSVGPVFNGEDKWEKAEEFFGKVTLEIALDMASAIEETVTEDKGRE